jgi:hypothetical protein
LSLVKMYCPIVNSAIVKRTTQVSAVERAFHKKIDDLDRCHFDPAMADQNEGHALSTLCSTTRDSTSRTKDPAENSGFPCQAVGCNSTTSWIV